MLSQVIFRTLFLLPFILLKICSHYIAVALWCSSCHIVNLMFCADVDRVEPVHTQYGSTSEVGYSQQCVFPMTSSPLGGISCTGHKLTPPCFPIREVTSGLSLMPCTFLRDEEPEIPPKQPRLDFSCVEPGIEVGISTVVKQSIFFPAYMSCCSFVIVVIEYCFHQIPI